MLTAATVLRGTTQLRQRQLARQDRMAAAERELIQARLRVLATTTDRLGQVAQNLDVRPPS